MDKYNIHYKVWDEITTPFTTFKIHYKVWDEITTPFFNFNVAAVGFWGMDI